MQKKIFFYVYIFGLLQLNCANTKQVAYSSSTEKKWNVILIVADDLGRNDLAQYGNQFIETPNLTAMAKEGLQCNNGYAAAPLCSPSRASIITGNNPARINLTEHLHGYSPAGPNQKLITPRIESGLPASLTTIAEALAKNNYKTAHIGKWHLGMGASSPKENGYQLVYGGGAEGLPNSFFYPFFNGNPYPNLLKDSKEGDYIDDVLTSRAIRFLENNKDSALFLSLNFYSPHVPIQGKPALVKKYAAKRSSGNYNALPNDEYAAMVESVDANVGRILQTVKNLKLDKNTLIVFTSDNGALSVEEVPAFAKHTPPTTNFPLKDGKGYITQGGIKTPWIIWGNTILNAGRIENSLVTTDDIFNTVMALTKTNAQSPDGVNILPLLSNNNLPDRNYYVHFPHYSPQHGKPGALVISGKYKLIEWYEDGKIELYDLSVDEGEKNNIAPLNELVVKQLKLQLDNWRKSVNAKMPVPNPDYNAK
jgi:arylsulfatase A